ncbi:MAG: hypothetical protein Harvfovirus66_11, partial [Harvfovirus sp.]
ALLKTKESLMAKRTMTINEIERLEHERELLKKKVHSLDDNIASLTEEFNKYKVILVFSLNVGSDVKAIFSSLGEIADAEREDSERGAKAF